MVQVHDYVQGLDDQYGSCSFCDFFGRNILLIIFYR
jgi:hypothetical protein